MSLRRERAAFVRLARVVGLAALLTGIVALLVLYLYHDAREPGFFSPGVPECRAAYVRARTPTDSAMIDAQHPSSGPQKDPNAPTCGMLRLIGRLR